MIIFTKTKNKQYYILKWKPTVSLSIFRNTLIFVLCFKIRHLIFLPTHNTFKFKRYFYFLPFGTMTVVEDNCADSLLSNHNNFIIDLYRGKISHRKIFHSFEEALFDSFKFLNALKSIINN